MEARSVPGPTTKTSTSATGGLIDASIKRKRESSQLVSSPVLDTIDFPSLWKVLTSAAHMNGLPWLERWIPQSIFINPKIIDKTGRQSMKNTKVYVRGEVLKRWDKSFRDFSTQGPIGSAALAGFHLDKDYFLHSNDVVAYLRREKLLEQVAAIARKEKRSSFVDVIDIFDDSDLERDVGVVTSKRYKSTSAGIEKAIEDLVHEMEEMDDEELDRIINAEGLDGKGRSVASAASLDAAIQEIDSLDLEALFEPPSKRLSLGVSPGGANSAAKAGSNASPINSTSQSKIGQPAQVYIIDDDDSTSSESHGVAPIEDKVPSRL
jgi:hypothetical protein